MKRRLASALPRCYIPIGTCMVCNVCIIYFEVSTHSTHVLWGRNLYWFVFESSIWPQLPDRIQTMYYWENHGVSFGISWLLYSSNRYFIYLISIHDDIFYFCKQRRHSCSCFCKRFRDFTKDDSDKNI